MRVVEPAAIHLLDQTRAALADLRPVMAEIDGHRPFDKPVVRHIQHEIVAETVYHSASIEGNSLNWRETIAVLESGVLVEGRRREAQEMLNLRDAFEYINCLTDGQHTLSEATIRSIHAKIMEGLDDTAGSYRTEPVAIGGATSHPPEHLEVPRLMQQIVRLYNEYADTLDPVLLATWLHHQVTEIHPFRDGNGRTARCLQALVLLLRRYVPCIIREGDRREYYEALAAADAGGFDPLVALAAERVLSVADKYITVIRTESEMTQWAENLAGARREKEEDATQAEYLEWRRQMERLRFQFQFAAAKINEQDMGVGVQVKEFETIDIQRWQNLRDLGRAERTSFFNVSFIHRATDEYVKYIFWFGKHFWRDIDTPAVKSRQRVSLLVSEEDTDASKGHAWVKLDDMAETRVSVREVLCLENVGLVRRRLDPVADCQRYDSGIAPDRVARDFIGEVLRNRFLLV